MQKELVVKEFLNSGILVSPDLFDMIPEDFDSKNFLIKLNSKISSKNRPVLLNKDLFDIVDKVDTILDLNWNEFEKAKSLMEKGKNGKIYLTFLKILNYGLSDKKEEITELLDEIKKPEDFIEVEQEVDKTSNIIILDSYEEESKRREVQNFVSYFRNRYETLTNILRNRQELSGVISISKILNKNNKESVSLIGLVNDKALTKNGNFLLTLEDLSGSINVLINKDNKDLFELASDLVLDEVIGITGFVGEKIVFVNNILLPDIPVSNELKKSPDEVYAAFISDLHVGSSMFLPESFAKFIKWIKGEMGSFVQKNIAKKTKYLFVLGDLVDGVGIYPEQDKELDVKDVFQQYELCADLLKEIPKNIKIIICPGNHDALRISEPQPVLSKKFARSLWNMPNVTMVSNPSFVNIHSSKDFPGFNVLLYHGYSFDYYVYTIESIRNKGGYDRADLIMKLLLQKRHLAPSHTSTLYVPDTEKDPLVIHKVPDLFVTGHIHKAAVSNYRNITMICGSCWQGKTTFQEKVGHNPEPARVPVVNLQTRQVKMMRF